MVFRKKWDLFSRILSQRGAQFQKKQVIHSTVQFTESLFYAGQKCKSNISATSGLTWKVLPKPNLAVKPSSVHLIQFGFSYMDYCKRSHWQPQHLLFSLGEADESMILPMCVSSPRPYTDCSNVLVAGHFCSTRAITDPPASPSVHGYSTWLRPVPVALQMGKSSKSVSDRKSVV